MTVATSVDVRRQDSITFLQLTGAGRLNAIGSPTCRALVDAVRGLENDGRTRAVVVHGAGRAFCAGADIEEISGFDRDEQFAGFVHGLTDAFDVLEASPLPFIAAVHGAALGGGLELALACDLRVAHADATLGLPEARLGVLPGAGGTQRLPRLVPRGVAAEMIMLGRPIDGVRAHQLGLVNRLAASADAVLADAQALATELAAGAWAVAGGAKSLLLRTADVGLAAGIAEERRTATALFGTPDGREGFAAFVAHRRPAFLPGQQS